MLKTSKSISLSVRKLRQKSFLSARREKSVFQSESSAISPKSIITKMIITAKMKTSIKMNSSSSPDRSAPEAKDAPHRFGTVRSQMLPHPVKSSHSKI